MQVAAKSLVTSSIFLLFALSRKMSLANSSFFSLGTPGNGEESSAAKAANQLLHSAKKHLFKHENTSVTWSR